MKRYAFHESTPPPGAAARLAVPGDLVIILTYTTVPDDEIDHYKPRIVHVNARNESIAENIFA